MASILSRPQCIKGVVAFRCSGYQGPNFLNSRLFIRRCLIDGYEVLYNYDSRNTKCNTWITLEVTNEFGPNWSQIISSYGVNFLCVCVRVITSRPGRNGCHFQDDISKCIFLNENVVNFDQGFNEACSHGSNKQYFSIGLDNGLVPARRQAINWTNDG